jgi:hypothetical protein
MNFNFTNPFNKTAQSTHGSKDIKKQVTDFNDFLELFPVSAVSQHSQFEATINNKAASAFASINKDFGGTVSDTLVFKVNIGQDFSSLAHTGADKTSTPSYLVVRLHEDFDEKSFAAGTQKMTILKYILDGKEQSLATPINLKTLLEYQCEIKHGYVPLMKSVRTEGYVPQYMKFEADGYEGCSGGCGSL